MAHYTRLNSTSSLSEKAGTDKYDRSSSNIERSELIKDDDEATIADEHGWSLKFKWLQSHSEPPGRTSGRQSTYSAVTIHLIFTLLNLSILSVMVVWQIHGLSSSERHSSPSCGGATYIDSPLASSMRYENRSFAASQIYVNEHTIFKAPGNEFNGPPREELEDAWIDLTQYQNLRLNQDQLGQFSSMDSIVQLSDEKGGYWATTATFHGLHCVERIHRSVYSDHYYPGLTDSERFTLRRHTEHCIDWLRRYVQCNADLTLIPLQWSPDDPLPFASDFGDHHCVAWDPLNEWMKEHSFNSSQPGLLIHPKFGDIRKHKSPHGGHSLGITPLRPESGKLKKP